MNILLTFDFIYCILLIEIGAIIREEGKRVAKLPKNLTLTLHAHRRLLERKGSNTYNSKNLMKSNCKWYGKDDLIVDSDLYRHCLYVCRKSNQMGYITDGVLEVLYNRGTGKVLTVLEMKDKFIPITQYIKPSYLRQIEIKKEKKGMKKMEITTCTDCGESGVNIALVGKYAGLCDTCRVRKQNAKSRGKDYIPYKDLTEEEKAKIDRIRCAHKKETPKIIEEPKPEIKEEKPTFNPLEDEMSFLRVLKECGCEASEENLKAAIGVLRETAKLKDMILTITKDDMQDVLLDLENMLNVAERKLQHNWEYNNFQEVDEVKFKGFLVWRRTLKSAIYFWKQLYASTVLIELQKAWENYASDPNDKQLMTGDRAISNQKRYQITTESISTIYNTKRPFTRIFYATSQEEAYEKFLAWMSDRQLHENKSKTTIVELTSDYRTSTSA